MNVIAAWVNGPDGYEFRLDLPGAPRVGDKVRMDVEPYEWVQFIVDEVIWEADEDLWIGLEFETAEYIPSGSDTSQVLHKPLEREPVIA